MEAYIILFLKVIITHFTIEWVMIIEPLGQIWEGNA